MLPDLGSEIAPGKSFKAEISNPSSLFAIFLLFCPFCEVDHLAAEAVVGDVAIHSCSRHFGHDVRLDTAAVISGKEDEGEGERAPEDVSSGREALKISPLKVFSARTKRHSHFGGLRGPSAASGAAQIW